MLWQVRFPPRKTRVIMEDPGQAMKEGSKAIHNNN